MTKITKIALIVIGALTLVYVGFIFMAPASLSPIVVGVLIAAGVAANLLRTAMLKLSSDEKALSVE